MNWFFDLKCPDCGATFTEKDSICPNCGADLDALIRSFDTLEKEPADEDSALQAQRYLEKAKKLYEEGRNLSGALGYCDLAIEQQPERAESHNWRGLILDAMGMRDEAILAYREAVRLDPSLEDASANLADAENEQRDRPEGTNQKRADWSPNWAAIILGGAGAVFLVLLCTVAYLVYLNGLPYFGPKHTLVFEPDPSLITSSVTQAELQETAQILTERAAQLGYPRITFAVSESGEITAQVPSQVDLETFSARIAPTGLIEFVDFGETPMAGGQRVATDLEYGFLQQGEGARYHTLMTNADIQSASVMEDANGKPAIQFVLTERGSTLFYEHTSQNVGKYLGIVRDKVVVSCPVISTAIDAGQGIIQGTFSKQEADDLAAILQTKPLPIPIRVKQQAGNH